MKKFILNFSAFISFFLIILSLGILIVNSIINHKGNFKIKKDSKYIVLGHSHPECAFNDSLISDFSNFGKSGESYFYTYFKMKKILEQNENLKTIFIEFSNNQIEIEMDKWIWNDEFITNRYPIFSPFMDLKDNWMLLNNNPSGFIKSLSLSLKHNFSNIAENDFEYTNNIGGYLYLKRDRTDSLIACQKKMPLKKLSSNNLSYQNLEYLDKIIKYCKERNVKIYLIRSPLNHNYKGFTNERDFQNLLSSKYSDIEFLDFSRFPLKNSEFGDLEHLNYRGARKFSTWFNKLVEQGLLNQLKKQQTIDKKIMSISTIHLLNRLNSRHHQGNHESKNTNKGE